MMQMLLQAWDAIEWNPFRWSLEARLKLAVFMLRLYVGGALFWVGYQQMQDPAFASYLPSLLMNWAQRNPFFFYEDFLRYIATPNAHILAWLIPGAQMAVGALLTLGLWTRWAVGAMFFLTLNYFFATQHTSPMAGGLNIAFMGIALVLLFAKAGYAYGVDQIIHSVGLHFGWIKPVKKRKKRRLAPPRPLHRKTAKLPNLRLLSRPLPKASSKEDRQDDDERSEGRLKTGGKKVESLRPGASRSTSIENALGNTIRKLKERQHLKPVAKPLKRYDPDELDEDDDDFDDEDDIYAYHGHDDDDDED